MNTDHLQLLFDYHYWAMNHLVNCLQRLPAEQVTTLSSHFYHGTAWQTVLHTIDTDWSWLQRCMGLPGTQYLWEVELLPDLEAVQGFLGREKIRVADYVSGLSETDLATKAEFGAVQDGQKRQVERWRILLHIINHGTEHRTELGHYLTETGNSPGELNFMYYLTAIRHSG